ncbi:CGNR zinc finger domain-containing protein [Streptomyces antimycoticus]|uniref:CGNR zinc finger domain-containing protein n=1 Tax=Streptomyces antimycoticus TaxID=68175 RepID=UPI001D14C001|nr:ABATE domain-containing protein [Streptomyces antimycoticus]
MNDFVFVSGRLSLDLAGTLLWRRSRRIELLSRPDDLRRWIHQAGLLDAPGSLDARALQRVCRLREAVYVLVRAWPLAPAADDDLREALAEVNEASRLPLPRHQLDEAGQLTRTGGVDEVLGAVARDAVDLMGGADFTRVRECQNEECTRLFVDLSRSTNRRWCGMAECGNRHKVASYRKRRQQAQ